MDSGASRDRVDDRPAGAIPLTEPVPVTPAFQIRPGSAVIATVVIGLFAGIIWVFATSPNIRWEVVGQYILAPQLLRGVQLTLLLTVISMIAGVVLGALAALGRLSSIWGFKALADVYIWFFRGTPLMVQVIFAFNLSLFIPYLTVGEWRIDTNTWMTSMMAACLALSLNEGAYMAEYIRGGILGVPSGQREAAISQGMTSGQALRRIILPQAMPAIVPAIGNQTISMLKSTSIVSVVAAAELLTQVQVIYNQNFMIIELLIVACIWYLFMVTVASILQYFLERKLGKSSDRIGQNERASWLMGLIKRQATARRLRKAGMR
ncbi:amino acid ABC transporter permease [Microbacterium sp.]|uniref:amino acid ABC transporter permease n=1 Tax=Microbacterium sp. TaxID=51671 RepID=UPI0039E21C7C